MCCYHRSWRHCDTLAIDGSIFTSTARLDSTESGRVHDPIVLALGGCGEPTAYLFFAELAPLELLLWALWQPPILCYAKAVFVAEGSMVFVSYMFQVCGIALHISACFPILVY